MKQIALEAKAKINLSLDILGKRPDGYHDLKMIMQTVDIKDIVTIELTDDGKIYTSCSRSDLPQGEGNIAYKAAEQFKKYFKISDGVKIHIDKKIPAAAGLAGGSTDAAAVLRGMNILFNQISSVNTLCEIGLQVGADVPYCIYGGTMLAEGVGERLTELPDFSGVDLVLIKPDFDVATAWAFKNYKVENVQRRPDTDFLISSLKNRDLKGLAGKMSNVLESVTAQQFSKINDIKNRLLELGAVGAMMSGSGPSVFGLFDEYNAAKRAYAEISAEYTYECFLTKTCRRNENE